MRRGLGGALCGEAGEGEVFDAFFEGFALAQDAAALQFVQQGFQRGFGALRQDEVAAVVVGEVVKGAEGGEVVGADAEGLLQDLFEFAAALCDAFDLCVVGQGEGGERADVAVVGQLEGGAAGGRQGRRPLGRG